MSEERSFELEIEVAATPDEVWAAIATGPGVTAWLQPTTIEERIGGRFAYDLGARGEWNDSGVVAEYDRPRRFATTGVRWQGPGGPDDAVTLATQWIIEGRPGGSSIVRLIMSGFSDSTDWDDEVGGVRDGMQGALISLQRHLATTLVRRRPQ